MTPHRQITFLAVSLVYLIFFLRPISPNDFWWPIAMGEEILRTGVFITEETRSYTAFGTSFLNLPWLAELSMAIVNRLGGPALQLFLHASAFALGLIWLLPPARAVPLNPVHPMILAVVTSGLLFSYMTARTQTLALPIGVLVWRLSYWYGYRGDDSLSHRVLLIPALIGVWANLHGSFPMGIALVAALTLGRSIETRRIPRAMLLSLFLSLLAPLLSPLGMGTWRYAVQLSNHPVVREFSLEWRALSWFQETWIEWIFPIFLAGLVGFILVTRPRFRLTEWVLLVGGGIAASISARFLYWYALIATSLLYVQVRAGTTISLRIVPFILPVLALLVLLFSPWIKPHLPLPGHARSVLAPTTPVAALDALRNANSLPKRLFSGLEVASYVLYALPETQIFIDPRLELYTKEIVSDYYRLMAGRDVSVLAERYQIDAFLLIKPKEMGEYLLIETLLSLPNFSIGYEDPVFIYFRRTI